MHVTESFAKARGRPTSRAWLWPMPYSYLRGRDCRRSESAACRCRRARQTESRAGNVHKCCRDISYPDIPRSRPRAFCGTAVAFIARNRTWALTFTYFPDGTAHKNRMRGNDFVQSPMHARGMLCLSRPDPNGSDMRRSQESLSPRYTRPATAQVRRTVHMPRASSAPV